MSAAEYISLFAALAFSLKEFKVVTTMLVTSSRFSPEAAAPSKTPVVFSMISFTLQPAFASSSNACIKSFALYAEYVCVSESSKAKSFNRSISSDVAPLLAFNESKAFSNDTEFLTPAPIAAVMPDVAIVSVSPNCFTLSPADLILFPVSSTLLPQAIMPVAFFN